MLAQWFCLPETHSLERRHDLDWLRVLVFGLLIFYHIGMLYVAHWDFHVKSEHVSVALESLMIGVNRWRMPLLWFVSGVAMRLVLNKISPVRFITQRSTRLLLPLLVGVLVIVPPQLYFEMQYRGDLSGIDYWTFYRLFFDLDNPLFAKYQPGILPHMDVNHLWFLRELWKFSLLVLVMTPLLRWLNAAVWLEKAFVRHYPLTLTALAITTLLIMFFGDDRVVHGFYFLLLGYVIGNQTAFWQKTQDYRRRLLLLAVLSYVVVVIVYNTIWLNDAVREQLSPLVHVLLLGFVVALTWGSLLAIFGYAKRYLIQRNKALDYLSEAVLPFYVIHQTAIIVVFANLQSWHLSPIVEALVISVVTVVICFVSYEMIRRVTVLRWLFGLSLQQQNKKTSTFTTMAMRLVNVVVLLPLALKILM